MQYNVLYVPTFDFLTLHLTLTNMFRQTCNILLMTDKCRFLFKKKVSVHLKKTALAGLQGKKN